MGREEMWFEMFWFYVWRWFVLRKFWSGLLWFSRVYFRVVDLDIKGVYNLGIGRGILEFWGDFFDEMLGVACYDVY